MEKRIIIMMTVVVLVALSCSTFGSISEEGAADNKGPELTSTALSLAQADIDMQRATLNAISTQDAQSEADQSEPAAQEATELPDQGGAEQTPVETDVAPAEDQDISQPGFNEQNMKETLDLLYKDGVISSVEGEFIPVDDFSEEIAMINYITWWSFDLEPEDFVIKADVAWNSASDIANWPLSGCGFVFSEEDESNFHLAYLSLDGYGFLKKLVNDKETVIANKKYGDVSIPVGEAEIILAVEGKNAAFYVNGKKVYSQYDGNIEPGDLALTVLSGTNKGFGTRCEMTNMGIWLLE